MYYSKSYRSKNTDKYKYGSSLMKTSNYGNLKQQYMTTTPTFQNSYHLPSSTTSNSNFYPPMDMGAHHNGYENSGQASYANIESTKKKRKKRAPSRSKTNTPYKMYKSAFKRWMPGNSIFKKKPTGPTSTTKIRAISSQSYYEDNLYEQPLNVSTSAVPTNNHKSTRTSQKLNHSHSSSSYNRPGSSLRSRLFKPINSSTSKRPKRSSRRKKKVAAASSMNPRAASQNFFREPPKSQTPSSRMFASSKPKKTPRSSRTKKSARKNKYHVYDDSLYFDNEVTTINKSSSSHKAPPISSRPQTTLTSTQKLASHYTTPKKEPKISKTNHHKATAKHTSSSNHPPPQSKTHQSPINKQSQPSIEPKRRRSSVALEQQLDTQLTRLQKYKFGTQDNSYRNYNDVDLRIDVIMYKFFIQSTMKRYFQYDLLDKFLEQVPNLDRKACRLDLDGISRSLRKLAHQHS